MPAIKSRLRIIAQNFIASSGLYREHYIPWQEVAVAASAVSGAVGASMSASRISASGPIGLLFAGASSGCFLDVSFRTPQDVAIAAPAAGSGQVLFDWTSSSVNAGAVTIAACLIQIPSGSEYVATGASQRLGSACTNVTGASIAQINSSSVMNFNAPTNRTGLWMLRFQIAGQDAATTTGSSFFLYGIRVRYLADRIGS